MFEVLILDVADVQKAIPPDAEVNESCLDAGLDIDDPAFVDVANTAFEAVSFDIELFEDAILDDADPAFFRLANIDQHFFFHGIP